MTIRNFTFHVISFADTCSYNGCVYVLQFRYHNLDHSIPSVKICTRWRLRCSSMRHSRSMTSNPCFKVRFAGVLQTWCSLKNNTNAFPLCIWLHF